MPAKKTYVFDFKVVEKKLTFNQCCAKNHSCARPKVQKLNSKSFFFNKGWKMEVFFNLRPNLAVGSKAKSRTISQKT